MKKIVDSKNGWGTLTLVLVILFNFSSCKKPTDADPVDLGYQYFPIQSGTFIEYQVDSIVYDDFEESIDTFQYFIKEVIGDSFEDLEGRMVHRLERYYRNDSSSYSLKETDIIYRTSIDAQRTEGGKTFVKLTFPLSDESNWNGNARNGDEEERYEVTEISAYEEFSDATTVQIRNNSNFIEDDEASEIYAAGIGLVFKEFKKIDLQRDSGLHYTMKFIQRGEE